MGTGNARRAIGPIETSAVRSITSPATNVQLAASLVGKGHTGRAEDISLDVEGTEGERLKIKLVGTSLIARASRTLGNERHLAGDGLLGDEGNVDAVDQELVLTSPVVLREVPGVERIASPEVGSQAIEATADGRPVARTRNVALGLRAKGGTADGNVGWVAAITFLTVVQAGRVIAELAAPVQAHFGRHHTGEEELPLEGALVIDAVRDTTMVGPVTEATGLGSRRSVDRRGPVGDDVHPVASAALLIGVAGAGVAALSVGCLDTAVVNGVVAEALNGVLCARDAVTRGSAGGSARRLAVRLAVRQLVLKDTSMSAIDPASLATPALGNTSNNRRGRRARRGTGGSRARRGRAWGGRAVLSIDGEAVAGAAQLGGRAAASHAALGISDESGAGTKGIAAVTFAGIFNAKVGVGGAEGLAGLESHGVRSEGGGIEGSRARSLGPAAMPVVVTNSWRLSNLGRDNRACAEKRKLASSSAWLGGISYARHVAGRVGNLLCPRSEGVPAVALVRVLRAGILEVPRRAISNAGLNCHGLTGGGPASERPPAGNLGVTSFILPVLWEIRGYRELAKCEGDLESASVASAQD